MFDVPNLDCLSTEPADLEQVAEVLRLLSAYAAERARTMKLRAAGHPETADVSERTCDRIYRKLPEWARW